MTRWIVSLESVPTPARPAVLKSLSAALGLRHAELLNVDHRGTACTDALDALLARIMGLARLPPDVHGLWSSSCILGVPEHPVWRRLYHQLSEELVARVVPRGASGTRHLMACLHVDANEAFESMFDGGSKLPCLDGRAGMEEIKRCCARISEEPMAPTPTPFQTNAVSISCPAFTADNPVALDNLTAAVVSACSSAMASSI